MSELEALRWVEFLGQGVVLERAYDDDVSRVRWFVSFLGHQAWGDRLVDALCGLRSAVEAKR